MDWTQPSKVIRWIFPAAIWRIKTKTKQLYLTFDDGPVPEITEYVLDVLKTYNIKATFFCIGKNVKANPEIFKKLTEHHHAVGNHTQNHEKGWEISNHDYFNSINECEKLVSSRLFRPPYGKITFSQYLKLKKHYKIIMWDVLTYDYDKRISAEESLRKSLKFVRPGSIIVFHDSIKAYEKLKIILPAFLTHCLKNGYEFETLENC